MRPKAFTLVKSHQEYEHEQAKKILGPKPEHAPNRLLSRLFEHPHLNNVREVKTKEKVVNFMKILNKRKIPITMLRSLSFRGIPGEVQLLRTIVWKVLIGYLPTETHKWETHMKTQKKLYEEWENELIIKPILRPNREKAQKMVFGIDYGTVSEHPLNNSKKSDWGKYFADLELWNEIEKDVRRTRTDLNFFTDAYDPAMRKYKDQLARQAEFKHADLCGDDRLNYIETHADILSRILFIYAKLNPGVKYVQGMNEVLACLYYCFYDSNEPQEFKDFFESDLFFCFSRVMTDLRDSFLRTMDHEDTGINGKVAEFDYLMKRIDPQLHAHLTQEGLDPQYYSLRWLMLLLSQEFELNNLIRMWDTVLADHDKFTFVNFICVAKVISQREYLLKNEFSECLECLQRQQSDPSPQVVKNILEAIDDQLGIYSC